MKGVSIDKAFVSVAGRRSVFGMAVKLFLSETSCCYSI